MLFPQNDLFQDFRWHESFLFFVYSPALQKRQENFEAFWRVKKILNHSRASRTFAWLLQYKPRFTFSDIECYFLKMTFFQDFRWHESFLFFVSSPALQKRQENFEACWSVKKLLKPTRASRTFTGRFYSIDQDLHFVILNVISSKWLFFKTLDGMKVFYFSFLVQHFKSIKKILKPAGASRNFWSLLERQELLQAASTV